MQRRCCETSSNINKATFLKNMIFFLLTCRFVRGGDLILFCCCYCGFNFFLKAHCGKTLLFTDQQAHPSGATASGDGCSAASIGTQNPFECLQNVMLVLCKCCRNLSQAFKWALCYYTKMVAVSILLRTGRWCSPAPDQLLSPFAFGVGE